jgi:DeoC/LacD family aldolase
MPLMIEPLVFRPNAQAGGYMVDGDLKKIMPLVRQAVELGADIIKADPTDNPPDYHRVVEVARVPVLVRGGGKAEFLEILRRTEQLIGQKVAGIAYGRNVIQHANPAAMTNAAGCGPILRVMGTCCTTTWFMLNAPLNGLLSCGTFTSGWRRLVSKYPRSQFHRSSLIIRPVICAMDKKLPKSLGKYSKPSQDYS